MIIRRQRLQSRCHGSKMSATKDLRKIFLQQFMREVILHASPIRPSLRSTAKLDIDEQKPTMSSLDTESKNINSIASAALTQTSKGSALNALRPMTSFRPFPTGGSHQPLPYGMHPIFLKQRPPPPKVYLAPQAKSWLVSLPSLSRIQPLLTDPTITTIECSGPGMPIMIARGSFVQSTPVHFSTDEISGIIREVSSRTKIPLNSSGVFKAAIGDIIITAVLSEFVGTRFVIQKKPKAPSPQPSQQRRR